MEKLKPNSPYKFFPIPYITTESAATATNRNRCQKKKRKINTFKRITYVNSFSISAESDGASPHKAKPLSLPSLLLR